MRRFIALLLATVMLLSLAACGGEQKPETPDALDLSGKFPVNEYERGIWYGFLPDKLADADPDTTIVTWKQYCAMLGKMIFAYDQSKLTEWEQMTADAPDNKELMRDGAAIINLMAAKTIGIDMYNHPYVYDESYSWGHHFSWDYPIFGIEEPIEALGREWSIDYAAFFYLLGRSSCVTNEPVFSIDNGDPHLEDALTLNDAVVAVTRLYESIEEVVIQTAEQLLELVSELPEVQELLVTVETRINEIVSTPTQIVKSDELELGKTYTRTAYYVSNNGNDNNDGLTPETAFATIERLAYVEFKYGDAIFFERGSTWRKVMLPHSVRGTEGLTISAYGEGEKPKFYGSPENGAGAEKWELYHEGENGEKIWRYHMEVADSSVVVLNEGESHATRSIPYWDGMEYLLPDDFSTPYDVREHLGDLEFFCELAYPETPVDDRHVFIAGYDDTLGIPTHLTGPLYLRCDNGNPGELYESIEFSASYSAADGLSSYTAIDNICFAYAFPIMGGSSIGETHTEALADGATGTSADYLVFQNCEQKWMGGNVAIYSDQNDLDFGYVWMDGGGFGTSGSHSIIQNNYIHHNFQDGTGVEVFPAVDKKFENVHILDNVMTNCTQTCGYGSWDLDSKNPFSDVTFENNYILFSGFDNYYGVKQRLETTDDGTVQQQNYLMKDSFCFGVTEGLNAHDGTVWVRNNTFAFSISQLLNLSGYTEEYSHVYDANTYIQLPGFAWAGVYNQVLESIKYTDADEAIYTWVQDQNATIITFD